MIDHEIKEYIRLIGSLSLDKTSKGRISDRNARSFRANMLLWHPL